MALTLRRSSYISKPPNPSFQRADRKRRAVELRRYALRKAGSVYWAVGTMAMNTTFVSRDPDIMSGALCFMGTRVPVQNLFDYLEGASSLEDFLEDFPSVSREMAVAVLEQARERLFADAPSA